MNSPKSNNLNRRPGLLIELKLNFTVLTLVFLIGVILVCCFFFFRQYRDELTFVSAIIGGLAAIYAGYYVALTFKTTTEREKVHRSFEIMHRLDIPDFVKVRTFLDKGGIDHKKDAPEQMFKKIYEDKDLRVAVLSLLSMFENLSIAIQRGYADEITLYLSTCVQIPYYYEKLAPFIEEIRRKYNDNTVCIEYEKLARSWKNQKFIATNKTIPKEILQK